MLAPPPQDLRHRGSWGMGRSKHCNAQKIPNFPTSELTKRCNAQIKGPDNPTCEDYLFAKSAEGNRSD